MQQQTTSLAVLARLLDRKLVVVLASQEVTKQNHGTSGLRGNTGQNRIHTTEHGDYLQDIWTTTKQNWHKHQRKIHETFSAFNYWSQLLAHHLLPQSEAAHVCYGMRCSCRPAALHIGHKNRTQGGRLQKAHAVVPSAALSAHPSTFQLQLEHDIAA